MDKRLRELIFQTLDQTITPEDFETLQSAIQDDAAVRVAYVRAVDLFESLGEFAITNVHNENAAAPLAVSVPIVPSVQVATLNDQYSQDGSLDLRTAKTWQRFAIAAMVLFLFSASAYWFGQHSDQRGSSESIVHAEDNDEAAEESLLAGHATLRRSVDLRWQESASIYRDGDVLPDGLFRFEAGVAEIDFFCGATLIVEGPAALDIESDWSVRVIEGRLRANVPPAARGFIVKAAESEIIDLGTEFAVEVGAHSARVEVIDGEVELRGGLGDGNHLHTGQQQSLKGAFSEQQTFAGLSTIGDLKRRRDDAQSRQLQRWQTSTAELRLDPRLIAYYVMNESRGDRSVANLSQTGQERDGALVGSVTRGVGRFSSPSTSLEFERPGARVRTRIEGEFTAFTFSCWARIDSLEHRYNAIFMGDGYENGEPHWQIHEDGRMMFSVMVDDTPGSGSGPAADARLHHIYFTPPIWDVSNSGQWIHLVAVFDPAMRLVTQYVNGQLVSEESITDPFYVETLRIGAAEIGNWGQPLRDSPWFAVRNLNGAIDELAIFAAALNAAEVETLYEQGKPLGY